MEKNIKEAISIIEDVRKSMPECTNKAFLKGSLNELNEALRLYAVMKQSEQLSDFERWAKLNAKNMHDIDYWIAEYRYQKSLNCA